MLFWFLFLVTNDALQFAKNLHDILGPPYSVRLPLLAVHLRDLALFTCIQDALSLTEFELMELLDVGLDDITSAVEHISEIACPPFRTVSCPFMFKTLNILFFFNNFLYLFDQIGHGSLNVYFFASMTVQSQIPSFFK